MSTGHPNLYPWTREQILKRLHLVGRELLCDSDESFPALPFDPETGKITDEATNALFEIFANFMHVLSSRLNRMPEKMFLAYLDKAGISRLTASAARTPVAFIPVEDAPQETIYIPAGTRVATPQTETEDAIVFETEHDLNVGASALKSVITESPLYNSFAHLQPHREPIQEDGLPMFGKNEPVEKYVYFSVGSKPDDESFLYLEGEVIGNEAEGEGDNDEKRSIGEMAFLWFDDDTDVTQPYRWQIARTDLVEWYYYDKSGNARPMPFEDLDLNTDESIQERVALNFGPPHARSTDGGLYDELLKFPGREWQVELPVLSLGKKRITFVDSQGATFEHEGYFIFGKIRIPYPLNQRVHSLPTFRFIKARWGDGESFSPDRVILCDLLDSRAVEQDLNYIPDPADLPDPGDDPASLDFRFSPVQLFSLPHLRLVQEKSRGYRERFGGNQSLTERGFHLVEPKNAPLTSFWRREDHSFISGMRSVHEGRAVVKAPDFSLFRGGVIIPGMEYLSNPSSLNNWHEKNKMAFRVTDATGQVGFAVVYEPLTPQSSSRDDLKVFLIENGEELQNPITRRTDVVFSTSIWETNSVWMDFILREQNDNELTLSIEFNHNLSGGLLKLEDIITLPVSTLSLLHIEHVTGSGEERFDILLYMLSVIGLDETTHTRFVAGDGRAAAHFGFPPEAAGKPASVFLQLETPVRVGGYLPVTAWEYWRETSGKGTWAPLAVEDRTKGFTQPESIVFSLPDDARKKRTNLTGDLLWVRARLPFSHHPRNPQLRAAYQNVVFARNSVKQYDDLVGSSNGSSSQIFTLRYTPVLEGQEIFVFENEIPPDAERAVLESEEGTGAVRVVRDERERFAFAAVRWHEVDDFEDSGQESRHYVMSHVEGIVQFGDGLRGKIPPPGRDNIRANYSYSGGSKGLVPAGAVTELQSSLPYIDSVVNIADALGGADAESYDRVTQRGPARLKTRERAVTSFDFAALSVSATSASVNASAIPNVTPENLASPGAVTVLAVTGSPAKKPVYSPTVVQEIQEQLARRSPYQLINGSPYVRDRAITGSEEPGLYRNAVHVRPPRVIQIWVDAELVLETTSAPKNAQESIVAALDTYINALSGGPTGDGWQTGRSIQIGELYRLLLDLEFVKACRKVRILANQQKLLLRLNTPLDLSAVSEEGVPRYSAVEIPTSIKLSGRESEETHFRHRYLLAQPIRPVAEQVGPESVVVEGFKEGDTVELFFRVPEVEMDVVIGKTTVTTVHLRNRAEVSSDNAISAAEDAVMYYEIGCAPMELSPIFYENGKKRVFRILPGDLLMIRAYRPEYQIGEEAAILSYCLAATDENGNDFGLNRQAGSNWEYVPEEGLISDHSFVDPVDTTNTDRYRLPHFLESTIVRFVAAIPAVHIKRKRNPGSDEPLYVKEDTELNMEIKAPGHETPLEAEMSTYVKSSKLDPNDPDDLLKFVSPSIYNYTEKAFLSPGDTVYPGTHVIRPVQL